MRKGKGWSLLELLTVIAIIAILVAILFPVFSRAKEAAKKATCLSNISQLAKAMRLYSLDYQEYIFFDRGRTDSALMVTGQYGQGYYLKKIMKNYIPNWDIWYCPSDMYAKKDFTCSAASFGCFNWTSAVALDGGVGYKNVRHQNDTDSGMIRLYSEMILLYGKDDMKMEHNELSYRFYPEHNEVRPVYIDVVFRNWWRGKGAYDYWDINPSSAELFQEDMTLHGLGVGGVFGAIYGKTWGFRDGHSVFHTYEQHGVNNYGEIFAPT
jgi:prepilin-type N-terminal cleavage/methylation domain-containing protein